MELGSGRRRPRWGRLLSARRAVPPVDDLGFVDLETVVVVGGEAGHRSDSAVDVEHDAAASADQVVVIVAHSIFVAGSGSGRLDPADEVLVDEDAERVVDRLARDRPDDRPDVVGERRRRWRVDATTPTA